MTPRILELTATLLARDRNHPSVFTWSICNESSFGYGFKRAHEWLRQADPRRPDAGSFDPGSLELHAQHNPITLAGIGELAKLNQPVLWDECWCVFQGIWGDVGEMWVDPGIRDYYAVPLPAIYARMMASPNLAGTQIWCWADDLFCVPHRGFEYGRQATACHFLEGQYQLPGRGLVGDAPWGVVDGWRRRKPEFWITKKLHSPVKVAEGPLPLPEAGQPLRVPVANEYDFTDLAEVRVHWELGGERGSASATGGPHTQGVVTVQPRRPVAAGDVLTLAFTDHAGREVDAYRLPLGHPNPAQPAWRDPGDAPLQILPENYLAGRGTRVVGAGFELAFDDATGALRRGVCLGQPLLLDAPRVHVLPSATPDRALPDPRTWHLDALSVRPEGANVRVLVRGRYEHLAGSYEWRIAPTGQIRVVSTFRYTGEKLLARELGLALAVPKTRDLLRWQRAAEWSVYPPDHIGRPTGWTHALAPHADRRPPTWSWADDNAPMGSNDFRSTKRHLQWATITGADGVGLCSSPTAPTICAPASTRTESPSALATGTGAPTWACGSGPATTARASPSAPVTS